MYNNVIGEHLKAIATVIKTLFVKTKSSREQILIIHCLVNNDEKLRGLNLAHLPQLSDNVHLVRDLVRLAAEAPSFWLGPFGQMTTCSSLNLADSKPW